MDLGAVIDNDERKREEEREGRRVARANVRPVFSRTRDDKQGVALLG
jgi:hypothetical protein